MTWTRRLRSLRAQEGVIQCHCCRVAVSYLGGDWKLSVQSRDWAGWSDWPPVIRGDRFDGTNLARSPAPYVLMVPCDPVIFVHVYGRIEWVLLSRTGGTGSTGANDIVISVVIIMTIPSRGKGADGRIMGICKCCTRAGFSIHACYVLNRIYLPRHADGLVPPAVTAHSLAGSTSPFVSSPPFPPVQTGRMRVTEHF